MLAALQLQELQNVTKTNSVQNDLQAMARCHRIGQDKDVTVYRLITDNTYEQNIFECSTRKQGTDSATSTLPLPRFQSQSSCFCSATLISAQQSQILRSSFS